MDAEAFVQSVHDHKDRVFSCALWLTRHRDDAADLTQEAFVRLWQHHQNVEQGAGRAWLLRTVSRLAIDRSRKKQPNHASISVLEHQLESDRPDAPVLTSEARQGLAQAIASLPERDQALLHLAHAQGLSSNEIGGILDMNDGAVRVALARARKRVLELVGAHEEVMA